MGDLHSSKPSAGEEYWYPGYLIWH